MTEQIAEFHRATDKQLALNERLAQYGARLRTIDGRTVAEMVDPNDNAQHLYQYRRTGDTAERRVLCHDGSPDDRGSPWELFTPRELASLRATRGEYHPILDPLDL